MAKGEQFQVYSTWRNKGRATYDASKWAEEVSASLGQFNTMDPQTELRLDTEMRKLNDGQVVGIVSVKQGSNTLLHWNNLDHFGEVLPEPPIKSPESMRLEGPGCLYEPWVDMDHAAVGWKCTRSDGKVEYLTLVPSFNDGPGDENVFLYRSESPEDGESLLYVNLFEEKPTYKAEKSALMDLLDKLASDKSNDWSEELAAVKAEYFPEESDDGE